MKQFISQFKDGSKLNPRAMTKIFVKQLFLLETKNHEFPLNYVEWIYLISPYQNPLAFNFKN